MKLPSPSSTWQAGKELFAMHTAQKAQDAARKQAKLKEALTFMVQAKAFEKNAASQTGAAKQQLLANAMIMRKRAVSAANDQPSSAPTFVDQIFTSLKTVFFGFGIATLIAVPIGILCGISPRATTQKFRGLADARPPVPWQ